MVELIMNKQNEAMKRYASDNGLLKNENVCWSGDMVQTMIGSIASASCGKHNNLSVLLCDDGETPKNPTNIIQVCGEDVQMATLVPSDVEDNSNLPELLLVHLTFMYRVI